MRSSKTITILLAIAVVATSATLVANTELRGAAPMLAASAFQHAVNSLMKPEAYLINTSRGPIVVEADLIALLRAGRIAGAGLDVFDVEPPAADHPFRAMDNVTVTPHLGYVTRETLTAFYTDTLEAVVAFADDAPIRVANPDALAHAKQRRS
jgi:phosphoglycerate dehydrogenase-like enzyme